MTSARPPFRHVRKPHEIHPGITREDILVCLRYASDILKSERVYPISV